MDADKDTEETTTKQTMEKKDDGASENVEQALFDQPLVQTGKRKRKSTELFSFQASKRGTEYTGGEGVRLGDIPFIEHSIARLKSDQLKILYRLCFDKAGTKSEIKRNLRDFNGFPGSEVVERKRTSLEKMYVPALKTLCEMLGLETSGKKEDLVTRAVEFLNTPADLGKVPKKRKSSSGSSRSRRKSKPSESDDEKDELEDDVMEEEKEGEENDDSVMDTSQAPAANGDTTSDDKVTKEPVKEEESKKDDGEVENKGEEQEDSKEAETKAPEEAETKAPEEAETKEESTSSSQDVAGDKVVPVTADAPAATAVDTGKEE